MTRKRPIKTIRDLQLPKVEVLKTQATKGLAEAGATMGWNCCSKAVDVSFPDDGE
jgi:hypothetical protein